MCEINLGDYLWCNLYGNKDQILCGHFVDFSPNKKLIALSPFSLDEYNKQDKMVTHTWVDVSLLSLKDIRRYAPATKKIGFRVENE